MSELTKLPHWEALESHWLTLRDLNLRDLFEADPQRFDQFSHWLDGILFDFSKNLITEETRALLFGLAKARNLEHSISDFFAGKKVNSTEERSARHMLLRSADSGNVLHVLDHMRDFVSRVYNGEWKGYTHKSITDIVHIGVGGSYLGPAMVVQALQSPDSKLKLHFVSTLDGEQAAELVESLNPETTLVIVVSKTFSTVDTLNNMKIFLHWFESQAQKKQAVMSQHFFGVSANLAAMTECGIPASNQFEFWEWVGGRYSTWSAVGLSIALAIGMEKFEELLRGAHLVDLHFQTTPLEKNIPVIMGLLTVWYRNFVGCGSHVILPYDAHLSQFPAYLQQLEMESCGKSVTQHGERVDYATGGVIWGDVGCNAEHAFFQLLHQGTEVIPADFIVPIQGRHNLKSNQHVLLAHALAQSRVLMLGQKNQPEYREYPGNRPSTTIFFSTLNPRVLGALMACYEHKIFVQSVIWGINPFDQWGVELGKHMANDLLQILEGKQAIPESMDSSTRGLINALNKL